MRAVCARVSGSIVGVVGLRARGSLMCTLVASVKLRKHLQPKYPLHPRTKSMYEEAVRRAQLDLIRQNLEPGKHSSV